MNSSGLTGPPRVSLSIAATPSRDAGGGAAAENRISNAESATAPMSGSLNINCLAIRANKGAQRSVNGGRSQQEAARLVSWRED